VIDIHGTCFWKGGKEDDGRYSLCSVLKHFPFQFFSFPVFSPPPPTASLPIAARSLVLRLGPQLGVIHVARIGFGHRSLLRNICFGAKSFCAFRLA
jgi:hypothetical protein